MFSLPPVISAARAAVSRAESRSADTTRRRSSTIAPSRGSTDRLRRSRSTRSWRSRDRRCATASATVASSVTGALMRRSRKRLIEPECRDDERQQREQRDRDERPCLTERREHRALIHLRDDAPRTVVCGRDHRAQLDVVSVEANDRIAGRERELRRHREVASCAPRPRSELATTRPRASMTSRRTSSPVAFARAASRLAISNAILITPSARPLSPSLIAAAIDTTVCAAPIRRTRPPRS